MCDFQVLNPVWLNQLVSAPLQREDLVNQLPLDLVSLPQLGLDSQPLGVSVSLQVLLLFLQQQDRMIAVCVVLKAASY